MPFCTKCGSSVEGRFCPQCGAAVAPPAAEPVPQPVAPGAPAVNAVKKTNPLVWILAGCLGLILIAGVIALSLGLFVAHKVRQSGLDPDLARRNPAMAVTKLLTAMNPNAEVVSVDEDKGIITVREKSTGRTVTMNFEDIKKGKIIFSDEHGEQVSIQAQGEGQSGSVTMRTKEGVLKAGAQWTPPEWLPVYSGAKVEGGVNSQSPEEEAGTGQLSTGDSVEDVLNFYEQTLRKQGYEVSRQVTTVTGQRDGGKRHINVTVIADGGATKIQLSYSMKK